MALTTTQQILEALNKSSQILVVFRKKFETDSVTAACALADFLKKFGKTVTVACDDFHVPESLAFLPGTATVQSRLNELSKLTVIVDVKDTELGQLSYDVKDGKLSVFITPKKSVLKKDHVTIETAPISFDLIFVVDTPDLESLGELYNNHAEMFQIKPVINIDYHPANENFGQILYHDMAVSSASELVYHLMTELKSENIDGPVAQLLLTGLISKTKSFTASNVTTRTLQTAKSLIELGADRNQVIKNLFRNKTLAVINLWGRVLARLRYDQVTHLGWSLIPEYDFIDTSTTEKNLDGVIDEFVRDIPGLNVFILFYQKGANSFASIYSLGQHDASALAKNYKTSGTRQFASITLLNTPLVEAEKKITEEIKSLLKSDQRD